MGTLGFEPKSDALEATILARLYPLCQKAKGLYYVPLLFSRGLRLYLKLTTIVVPAKGVQPALI